MVKIKPLEEISKRYDEAASFVPARYKRAVEKVSDWKTPALEGQELYDTKMSSDEVRARRGKAIEKMSNEDWKKPAVELGSRRIGTGMKAKVDKHKKKFAPFHSALSALELPKRSASWEENIENRLKAVVSTLVAKKKEILGE